MSKKNTDEYIATMAEQLGHNQKQTPTPATPEGIATAGTEISRDIKRAGFPLVTNGAGPVAVPTKEKP